MKNATIKSLGFTLKPFSGSKPWREPPDKVWTGWVVDDPQESTPRWADVSEILLWHILDRLDRGWL
jgi:hypothetical protein